MQLFTMSSIAQNVPGVKGKMTKRLQNGNKNRKNRVNGCHKKAGFEEFAKVFSFCNGCDIIKCNLDMNALLGVTIGGIP